MAVIRSRTGRRTNAAAIDVNTLPQSFPARCGPCGAFVGTATRTMDARLIDDPLSYRERAVDRLQWDIPRVLFGMRLRDEAKGSIDETMVFQAKTVGTDSAAYVIPDFTRPSVQKLSFDCPKCGAHHSFQPATLTRLVAQAVGRGDRHVLIP